MNVLYDLMSGFALNFATAFIIIRLIYYPANRKQEYIFTFFSFNTLIYFVSGLLRDVQLSVGFGFGLLAVFSMLRYRTRAIPIKDMTYIFICITIPFMNTLFMATRITFPELILINMLIVFVIYALEKKWGLYYTANKQVTYEKIELIKPEHYPLLLEDLRQRTGLDIKYCKIDQINFLRDTAEITIYYNEPEEIYASIKVVPNKPPEQKPKTIIPRSGVYVKEN